MRDCARLLVPKNLAVMSKEIKNLKLGSGSTVCSEASTGVGLGAWALFHYGLVHKPRSQSRRG